MLAYKTSSINPYAVDVITMLITRLAVYMVKIASRRLGSQILLQCSESKEREKRKSIKQQDR